VITNFENIFYSAADSCAQRFM